MASQRLFVGIRIEAELQPDLQEVWRRLRVNADKKQLHIKWSPPENWHVTLKFLGELDERHLPLLTATLTEVGKTSAAFRVRAGGIGAFPDERRARVIWAGMARSQALLNVQSTVDDAFSGLAAMGGKDDGREFHPHITLGRLRSAGSVRDLISPFVRRQFADCEIRDLVLFASVQRGPFPVYVPLSKAVLSQRLPSLSRP